MSDYIFSSNYQQEKCKQTEIINNNFKINDNSDNIDHFLRCKWRKQELDHHNLLKQFNFNLKEMINIKEQYGVIYHVTDSEQNSFALKLFKNYEYYQREMLINEKIKQINGVTKIIKYFDNKEYYLILRNLCKGSIEQIKEKQVVSNYKMIGMIKQLVITIHEIHQQGILFTNLKPSNVLIDDDNKLYINLGQNWICKENLINQNTDSEQNVYQPKQSNIIKQSNQIQNKVNLQNNYLRLGYIICFLISKFCHNQILNSKELYSNQTEYLKQICIQFPNLIPIINSFLNNKNLIIDQIIYQLEIIHSEVEQKIFSFDEQFQMTSFELISDLYFTDNNIVDQIKLQIGNDNQQQQIQNIQNKYNEYLEKIVEQIKHMNGQNFNLTYQHVIFYINYLCFTNNKCIYSQQKLLSAENLKFQNKIKNKLLNSNKFDYFQSHSDFPIYLLLKFYEQHNIQIYYTKTQINNQILNNVLEHLLFSGTIEDTFYMDLKFDDSENFNFQIVKNNPIILRNKLNELGLEDCMVLNIYEGSTCCHLYSIKEVEKKIGNRTKELYRSFLDGQKLHISDIISPSHNIYYTVDHFRMKQQYRGVIKNEKQPHNFPVGYYGIGLNVEKYKDEQFLKSTTEEGVWITAFHGTKPNNLGNHYHISNIIEGFHISKNSENIRYKDAMANQECRFNKQKIGEGNIYFANSIRTDVQEERNDYGGAEVYTKPFQINDNYYTIIFMCRLNYKEVYSPKKYPVQILVKEPPHARPYRVLIMETIKDENEIAFNFEKYNEKQQLRSNMKHYENETVEELLSKLQASKIYDPEKERLKIVLSNSKLLDIYSQIDKKKTFKQLIEGQKPTFKYKDPKKKIKIYNGIIEKIKND